MRLPESRKSSMSVIAAALLVLFSSLSSLVGADDAISDGPSESNRVHGLYFGEPLPGLAPDLLADYYAGLVLFSKFWSVDDGLGPRFNERSCATCHAVPMAGGSGISDLTFVQHDPAVIDPTGGTVVQKYTMTADQRMVLKLPGPDARLRRTPSLFGLGLLEAVPLEFIRQYADPDDRDGDGISGRVGGSNDGVDGRFGWKARSASIDRFVGDALLTELGLTSASHASADAGFIAVNKIMPDEKPEVTAEQTQLLAQFIRLLAAPPKIAAGEKADNGEQLFENIGCDRCHRTTLTTGHEFTSTAHRGVTFKPYTDLLLHDMGAKLADDIVEGVATVREFRTPPLWGLKSVGPPFLHDGSAMTIEDAILRHGGEAEAASQHFSSLARPDQAALIHFLETR